MTRRRWIADEVDLSKRRAYLIGEHAAHLARVLRARIGQQFDIVVNHGTDSSVYHGAIASVSPSRVEFELGAECMSEVASPEIHLVIAVFKFDRMEWAIEKATELGVTSITPVIARRTEPHFASAANKRLERWKRIALEASQQARRSASPELLAPLKLEVAVGEAKGCRIVLTESERETTLQQALEACSAPPLTLATGPEGGWTADELEKFRACGWIGASLGPNILRAETAVVASVAICMARLQ